MWLERGIFELVVSKRNIFKKLLQNEVSAKEITGNIFKVKTLYRISIRK